MVTKRKSFLTGFAVIALIIALIPSHTVSADTYKLPASGKCNNNDTQINQNGTAQCQTATTNGTAPAAQNTVKSNGSNDNDTTCAIEKIGWILCPVIETSGKIGDQAFNMLARFFLQTEPELVADNSGTKIAWELARNLANIMFIIAFLAIIISQVTSMGINNYGIKKMLPRLVVAAIAVNVSYYICQLAVDLSNIVGWEIKDFLVQTALEISKGTAAMPIQTGIDNQTASGNLGTLGALSIGILALGSVLFFLPVLLSVVVMIAITCMIIVIILLLRKAIIVLLVVVSPIAFVLYLLPNTEKFFSRWMKMFGQLLMVFPVVALLFGGGQLASNIVLVAGSQQGSQAYSGPGEKCIQLPSSTGSSARVGNCSTSGSATPVLLGLVAAGIAVAPLIAVWSVLQGALAAAGAIGGKIQSGVSKVSSPLGKGARSADQWKNKRVGDNLQGRWQNMQSRGIESNNMVGRFARRGAQRERRLSLAKSDLERSKAQAMTEILGDERTAGALTSGLSTQGAEAARMGAVAAQRKTVADEINAEGLQIADLQVQNTRDQQGNTIEGAQTQAQRLINAGDFDSPRLAALLQHIAKIEQQSFMNLASQLGGHGQTTATRTASAIMSGMGGFYGGGDAARMLRGETMDLRATARNNIAGGSMSSNNISTLSNDGVGMVRDLVSEELANGNTSARDHVAASVSSLSADQRGNLSQQKQEMLDSIQHLT